MLLPSLLRGGVVFKKKMTMTADSKIREYLKISEQRFFDLAFDIFTHQAGQYIDLLPQYLQRSHENVFLRSKAFRVWFNTEKEINDNHILAFIEALPRNFRLIQPEDQYIQLQQMYFEERGIFPNAVILRLVIQEYKERVSLAASAI